MPICARYVSGQLWTLWQALLHGSLRFWGREEGSSVLSFLVSLLVWRVGIREWLIS